MTLGRSADPGNVHLSGAQLARLGVELAQASRGGDVTYHGPGQLVGYPIVRLRAGVLGHMMAMARAVAAVLAEQGIQARWRRDAPGLWVGDAKICAMGVHVRRRVAIHGFALNVAADLRGFDLIVPCGIAGVQTTSIEAQGVAPPALEDLAARVAARLGAELGVHFARGEDEVNCNVESDH